MRKIIFSVLFSILSFAAFAQGKQIEIRSSELVKGFQSAGFVRIIRPVFAQEGSTLAADSADFNRLSNTFDAFGHVVITQPSGTTIYSDLLNYNGNTKLAILTNNVRLIDGDVTLTTGHLTYNMTTRIGTYTGGGTIVNGQNVLTSRNGYYFAASRDAYFRYDVVLTSPDALTKTDTLRYNSTSKIAYFYGPTNIYGKDDTLYTENGTYNTTNDQARFGKKNLYTQGSKSLKGDSLFYDRKAGFGRAIGNITFIDTAEKAMLRGGIGLYRKSDESILVTKSPYVVITSESDSAKVDSIWLTADTLFSKVIFTRDLIPYHKEELKSDTSLADVVRSPEGISNPGELDPSSPLLAEDSEKIAAQSDTTQKQAAANTVPEKAIPLPKVKPGLRDTLKAPDNRNARDTTLVSRTDILSVKVPMADSALAGTSRDTTLISARDTLIVKVPMADSALADTSRARIVMAYHNAKIFKSDLQAKADSMFFSYADSTLRCYFNPMLWSQGSQLSGDTVYLQMKNKKVDNMLLQHNSFIVNTEEADSTNFNQIKGKLITGYFRDNKLSRMFVDGNAESVYYLKDDTTYSGLNHLIGSRLKLFLNDSKLKSITAIRSIEASITPIQDLKEEDRVLKGFIWKPRDRPKSKDEIISPPAVETSGTQLKPPVKTLPITPDKTPPKPASKPLAGAKKN